MSAFVNADGDLRSGWRFTIYLVVFVLLWVATGLLVPIVLSLLGLSNVLLLDHEDIRFLGVNFAAFLIPTVVTLLFMARFVDHAPLVLFGVGLHQRWLRDFAVGLAFAGGMLLVLLVGATLSGHAAMRWTASREILPHIAGTVLVLMIAAANEEMLFRGYPLQTLIKGVGPTPAVLSISAIFGIVHGFNPNATLLGVLNTILAGVLLSLAYLKTRSLWFPYGIHIGWNAGLGVVLGFPLSGLDTASFWTTNVVEPSVFLGGAYGPEAGVIGTLIFAAGIWRVRTLRGLKVSPEVASALGGQKPARSK